ncbi:hypothetical protein I79_013727 [Cricetulus griseus]|uniref:Uncharacterized protein n=1 Tax=Cricetulus griseus TaxID=10029 RepID=G3HS98_CRIGR|nr:hypothetical protein I79_013727 [Cricetulus griseus]
MLILLWCQCSGSLTPSSCLILSSCCVLSVESSIAATGVTEEMHFDCAALFLKLHHW